MLYYYFLLDDFSSVDFPEDDDLDSPLLDELFFSCETDLEDLLDPEFLEALSDRPADVADPVVLLPEPE